MHYMPRLISDYQVPYTERDYFFRMAHQYRFKRMIKIDIEKQPDFMY
jgi:hypothetical protein